MKVTIISPAYPYRGGMAQFAGHLYKALTAQGISTEIVNFKRLYPSILFPGKTQYEPNANRTDIPTTRLIDSINPFSWIKTAKHIISQKPDVIVVNFWLPFIAPAYANILKRVKKKLNCKVIFLTHNVTPHEDQGFKNQLTKLAFKHVDHHIVMSEAVGEDLLNTDPSAQFTKVFHPIYDEFPNNYTKQQARQKLGLAENENVALFFGYVRAYKGLGLLLESTSKALESVPFKLLIAGEFYEDEKPYLDQIEKLRLHDHVILKNEFIPSEEIGLYFSVADVVALPYLSATQSGIVLTAYQFDKPVIVTDVGGLPEFVQHEKTGLIVEANNSQKFAQALVHFFTNDSENYSQNVAEFKKEFSWDKMVAAIKNIAEA